MQQHGTDESRVMHACMHAESAHTLRSSTCEGYVCGAVPVRTTAELCSSTPNTLGQLSQSRAVLLRAHFSPLSCTQTLSLHQHGFLFTNHTIVSCWNNPAKICPTRKTVLLAHTANPFIQYCRVFSMSSKHAGKSMRLNITTRVQLCHAKRLRPVPSFANICLQLVNGAFQRMCNYHPKRRVLIAVAVNALPHISHRTHVLGYFLASLSASHKKLLNHVYRKKARNRMNFLALLCAYMAFCISRTLCFSTNACASLLGENHLGLDQSCHDLCNWFLCGYMCASALSRVWTHVYLEYWQTKQRACSRAFKIGRNVCEFAGTSACAYTHKARVHQARSRVSLRCRNDTFFQHFFDTNF